MGVWQSFAQQIPLDLGRRFSLLLIESPGDGLHPLSAGVGGEDHAHGLRRLFHDHHPLGVFILEVAEGRDEHDALLLLLPVAGAYPAAAVPGVEVVDQALESDDQVVILIEGVDVFRGGEHPDIVFPQVVNEQGRLGAVAPQTGQVLHHNGLHEAGLHRLVNPVDAGAVEVHPAHIVIKGFPHHFMAVADGVVVDDFPLIAQGVEFLVLVPREAIVQPDLHRHLLSTTSACATQHITGSFQ